MGCARIGISMAELARRVGTSPQNLQQRLKVGKMTEADLQRIAEALGAVYEWRFRYPDGTEL